ncbi:hypothetical protein GCM10020229_09950 [Kitasatospora albolonga]
MLGLSSPDWSVRVEKPVQWVVEAAAGGATTTAVPIAKAVATTAPATVLSAIDLFLSPEENESCADSDRPGSRRAGVCRLRNHPSGHTTTA